ncbi:PREDICTED: transcription factor HES-5-like [Tinamus guttatus]|uniref:transcription factor HES-5-like n=1 Tax=Tinamus guttatus TaxID=94827 RepID=UPI00052E6C32|nr:PREDICTED: transcription factor HES-5-like [Tinamus guttatus]
MAPGSAPVVCMEEKLLPREKNKLRKPVVEKMRRDRINSSIEQLKLLLEKEFQRHQPNSKLEKADILEVTVSYLRQQSRLQDPTFTHKNAEQDFNSGYLRCLREALRFLSYHEPRKETQAQLIKHLCKAQMGSSRPGNRRLLLRPSGDPGPAEGAAPLLRVENPAVIKVLQGWFLEGPLAREFLFNLRKPIVEKLRRDRINSSIEQLKLLLEKEFQRHQPSSKLEKADILEMTLPLRLRGCRSCPDLQRAQAAPKEPGSSPGPSCSPRPPAKQAALKASCSLWRPW